MRLEHWPAHDPGLGRDRRRSGGAESREGGAHDRRRDRRQQGQAKEARAPAAMLGEDHAARHREHQCHHDAEIDQRYRPSLLAGPGQPCDRDAADADQRRQDSTLDDADREDQRIARRQRRGEVAEGEGPKP
jgi:hypothetical protein